TSARAGSNWRCRPLHSRSARRLRATTTRRRGATAASCSGTGAATWATPSRAPRCGASDGSPGRQTMAEPYLIADIGGTNARFALARDGAVLWPTLLAYATADFASLE